MRRVVGGMVCRREDLSAVGDESLDTVAPDFGGRGLGVGLGGEGVLFPSAKRGLASSMDYIWDGRCISWTAQGQQRNS